ncbi:MAG: hypothetical protein KDI60_18320 [Xanthomonadales bacterium]|nr:hypothetical protein [Xanthomonadales bacterium]
MTVVLAMAGHTTGVRLAMFLAGDVTSAALRYLVFAGERKIGECMVEVALIKPDDACAHAQMFAMAVDAALTRLAPVQTALHLELAGDFLVAVQAQLRLLFLVEGRVTAFALRLVGLMALDHLAGHQRALQQARFGASAHQSDGEQHQPQALLKSAENRTQVTLSD